MRVLIVDDEASARQGLRMLLQFEPEIEVVGEANNGSRALERIEQLRPDIVLMDVRMPGMDGFAATREITRCHPGIRVLLMSLHDDGASTAKALAAGAIDFIPKHAIADRLVPVLLSLVGKDAGEAPV